MDKRTLRILEFDKILKIMAGFTGNETVARRILDLQPETELNSARELLAQTSEAASMLLRHPNLPSLCAPYVSSSLKRCTMGGMLSAKELLEIAKLLSMARSAKKYLESADSEEFEILYGINEALFSVKSLEEQIFMCIISEEQIADGASGELASIRRKMRNLQSKIKDMLDSYIHSQKYQKYLQDAIVTMRGDRYVIPVRSEYRSEINGVVHDTSASGATVFIEPMSVVNANNEIRDLIAKEQAEIERILAALSAEVSEYTREIELNYESLCELDFIFCKGKLSLHFNCSCPVLNDKGIIYLKKARHPLIDAKAVVANDIYLGDEFDTLVITGPNTGGKTVTLKTIGLFCLMASSGLHIPALDNSSVAVFSGIWADIGDEQSIEQNLSTFSAHMKNIVSIVNNIDENSLALFDELGAGTDPVEGAALAVAILEYLRLNGAKVAATTHYSELKLFALSTPGVSNASCEFDVATLKPTYNLLIGVPGKSNAFAISKRLGLDDTIIERSKAIMSEDNIRFEDLISDLEHSKNVAQRESERAVELRRETDELRGQIEAQKKKLEENRQQMLNDARREAKKIILDAKDEAAGVIRELNELKKKVQAENVDKLVQDSRDRLKKKQDDIDDSFTDTVKNVKSNEIPKNLKAGDLVEIVSLGQAAEVLKAPDADGNVAVMAGAMKLTVKLENLRRTSKNEQKKKHTPVQSGSYTPRKKDAKTEVDLRGLSLEEAVMEAQKFLDDAYMAGFGQVSIIHGKGTGVLRQGIMQMLRSHSLVKSYRAGRYGEGETGVTIVEMKQ